MSETITCRTCKEEKPVSEYHRKSSSSTGRASRCKPCERVVQAEYYQRNKEKIKARVSAWQIENADKKRANDARYRASGKKQYDNNRQARRRKRVYGITEEQYAEMLERAGGVCEICGRVPSEVSSKGACVDHCHETGKVRGILCIPCNTGIGNLRDDPAVLRKALSYLENHSVHDVVG